VQTLLSTLEIATRERSGRSIPGETRIRPFDEFTITNSQAKPTCFALASAADGFVGAVAFATRWQFIANSF
jgi:hypothetical protein